MKAFVKRGSALFSIFCLKGGVLGNLKEQFGWGHLRQNLLVSGEWGMVGMSLRDK